MHPTRAGYDALARAWHDGITDAGPGGAVLVSDGFDRGDGNLGATDSGQVWTASSSWRVAGGRAAAVDGSGELVALVDAGVADGVVSARLTLSPSAATPSLSLRAVGASEQLLVGLTRRSGHDRVSLYKVEAGRYSKLAEVTGLGLVLGQTYGFSVVLDGPSIEVFVDGTSVLSHVLSAGDQSRFGSRTLMGLRTYLAAGTDDGRSRWDDFTVAELP